MVNDEGVRVAPWIQGKQLICSRRTWLWRVEEVIDWMTGIELDELHECPTGNFIKHEVSEKRKIYRTVTVTVQSYNKHAFFWLCWKHIRMYTKEWLGRLSYCQHEYINSSTTWRKNDVNTLDCSWFCNYSYLSLIRHIPWRFHVGTSSIDQF